MSHASLQSASIMFDTSGNFFWLTYSACFNHMTSTKYSTQTTSPTITKIHIANRFVPQVSHVGSISTPDIQFLNSYLVP